jgi:hypothetical protein
MPLSLTLFQSQRSPRLAPDTLCLHTLSTQLLPAVVAAFDTMVSSSSTDLATLLTSCVKLIASVHTLTNGVWLRLGTGSRISLFSK